MFIIFGSSGFIGKKLKNSLIEFYGNKSVKGIGRRKDKNIKIDLQKEKNFKNIPKLSYDCVYILAGKSDFIFNKKKKEKLQINENISILKNIIKFCKYNNVKKIFFLSSSAVYSKKNSLPFDENQKINPNNSLGISKFKSEKILKSFLTKTSIKVIILRVFTVYGTNMRKGQFLYQAIKKFKSKNKKIVFWNKNTYRNFIHVDDLIHIIIKLTKINTPKYAIYNIGSNRPYKIETVINYLNKISGKKREIIYKNNENNLSHKVNISKIKNKIKLSFKDFKKELIKLYEGI